MRLSLSARQTAQPVSVRCSRLGCPGTARFDTICGGPAYCGLCWRRYIAARTVQVVLSPDGDRTLLWWWQVYLNSADNRQVAQVLQVLHSHCSAVVMGVDDIDRRSAKLQTLEVLA